MNGDYNRHKSEIAPLIFEKNVILKKQKKIIEKSPLGIKNPKRAFVFGLNSALALFSLLWDFDLLKYELYLAIRKYSIKNLNTDESLFFLPKTYSIWEKEGFVWEKKYNKLMLEKFLYNRCVSK